MRLGNRVPDSAQELMKTTNTHVGHPLVPENVAVHVLYSADEVAEFLAEIGFYDITDASVNKIIGILRLLSLPVTVVCEYEYVDPVHRDMFYICFSSKFIGYNRNCTRLSFFLGELDSAAFYRYDEREEQFLQDKFAGVCVLRPIRCGEVGLTVLNPEKLNLPGCYLKTTRFLFYVLGHPLTVEAYPYSSQDTEVMTCAEVTIWSILEYYGVKSPEYRTVLPSQIIKKMERLSAERALPSQGSEYSWISMLLKSFGFAPRLYDRRAFGKDIEQRREFKRLFHYYVESGIPLAVGISGRKLGEEIRHSVVCIGHGSKQKPVKAFEISYMGDERIYPYIDSAFLFDDYVFMDDNQIPYQIEPFGKLSGWSKSEISTFAVPLAREIFLEAGDVSVLVNTVFADENLGIFRLIPEIEEQIDQNNPLILRVFLSRADSYKSFRARYAGEPSSAIFYAAFQLPAYIWVAEISTYAAYRNHKIYGEIVIDATAGRGSQMDSLIMIRYLNHMGFRKPDEDAVFAIDSGLKCRTRGLSYPYEMYGQNLKVCGRDEDL